MRLSLIAFLLTTNIFAADLPNFTGQWKLNSSRSQYGTLPAPALLERKVTQAGVNITLDSVQKGTGGEVASHYVYTTDGKPTTNKVPGGAESTGTAHWEGRVLVIESAREYKGATLKQTDHWTLTDANTLTVDALVDVPTGKIQVKQVFERQK